MVVVLITGCSTGIGRQAAIELQQAGHTVVATARNINDITQLQELGMSVLALDVTTESSMQAAVAATVAQHGRIDALVNNAGYGAYMPLEETSDDLMRHMFEVNVFGLQRLTQMVLPHMRNQGSGRIVNVASIAGHISFPMMGTYCATKFAVRAMSLALHAEVKRFGIRVSLVEPGRIKTEFGSRAVAESSAPEGSPYALLHERFNGVASGGRSPGPHVIAKRIVHAVTSRRSKLHYLAPWDAKSGNLLKRLLPDTWVNFGARRLLGWK